jgi:hypothetical protein
MQASGVFSVSLSLRHETFKANKPQDKTGNNSLFIGLRMIIFYLNRANLTTKSLAGALLMLFYIKD